MSETETNVVNADQSEPQPETETKLAKPIMVGERGVQLGNLGEVYRLATAIIKAGCAPSGMEKPESIVVAILTGMELGIGPMQALQNIYIVNGRPALFSELPLALVVNSGQLAGISEFFEARCIRCNGTGIVMVDKVERECPTCYGSTWQQVDTDRYEGKDGKPDPLFRAVCVTTRKGGRTHRSTFSVLDAMRAGYMGKNTYKNHGPRMLMWRARQPNLRDQFPEVIKGLVTVEEAHDIPPADPVVAPLGYHRVDDDRESQTEDATVIDAQYAEQEQSEQAPETVDVGEVESEPVEESTPTDVAARAPVAVVSMPFADLLEEVGGYKPSQVEGARKSLKMQKTIDRKQLETAENSRLLKQLITYLRSKETE